MKERFYVAICVLVLILIPSYATANLTSFRVPEFAGKSFHKILVVAQFSDLALRKTAETAFVDRLARYGVEAVPSMQIVTPARSHMSEFELIKALVENKIEAMLIVKLIAVSKLRMSFELQLLEAPSGKIAWTGTSPTRGNAFTHFDKLINSLAGSAVRQLVEDGLVR